MLIANAFDALEKAQQGQSLTQVTRVALEYAQQILVAQIRATHELKDFHAWGEIALELDRRDGGTLAAYFQSVKARFSTLITEEVQSADEFKRWFYKLADE